MQFEVETQPLGRQQYSPWGRTGYDLLVPLGLYGFTLLAIVTVNFLLPRAMPGDPLNALFDAGSLSYLAAEGLRSQMARYYGLDLPLGQQYLAYLGNLLRGDLGWSISLNAPVGELIAGHLPWTILIMLPSVLLSTAVSLVVGGHAGWVRGSVTDKGLLVAFVTLGTVPVYLVGIALLLLFGVRLGWLPISGAHTLFGVYGSPLEQLLDLLAHLALPVGSLTLTMIGRDFLLARASMITVMGEDFMLVARAKGLADSTLEYRHGLRNALLPVFTRFSLKMGTAVSGAVLVETLFAYPGMGRLMFNAVASRDYPVLQGCFLVAGVGVLLANMAADLTYRWIDPRTRRRT